ncbi:hypothetical protein [Pedobacter alpinus]|uniref:Uncharacterized protein n=1 Tax=Pedobacter alpinus TaxID=1590643 RepID=A0ABW5TQT9_9SPHI
MKKLKCGLIMLMIIAFGSCKKDENKTKIGDKNEVKNIGVIKVQASRDGVWDVLGYGYDVTGDYANINDTKLPIIDVTRLKSERPDVIGTSPGDQRYGLLKYGENAEDYSSDLSRNLKATTDFKVFKGTLTSSFGLTQKYNNKDIYAQGQRI